MSEIPIEPDVTTEEYEARMQEAATAEFTSEQLGLQIKQAIRDTQTLARQVIIDLRAEKVRAQTVIDKTNAQITPGDTKDVARACKRIADATIDFAKLVIAMGISVTDPPPPA